MTLATINPEVTTALERLEVGRQALLATRDDLERWRLAQEFDLVREVAERKGLPEIASLASTLVQDARRMIAEANPPRPIGYPGHQSNVHPSNITPERPPIPDGTLRRFRALHSKLPEEEYQEIKDEKLARAEVLTEQDLRQYVKERDAAAKREERDSWEPAPLPTGLHSLILADPPWQYGTEGLRGSASHHYPEMATRDIAILDIAPLVAEDAVLFLWATNPKLPAALEVMAAWGFEYRTNLAWVKPSIGTGFRFRSQHELLLVGVRGDWPAPPPNPEDRPSSVIDARRREHSQKPDQVYEMLERLYPALPKLELFSREPREGWTAWGNEV